MKKLLKINLNILNEQNINNIEMNRLKGGDDRGCSCSCYWADKKGGASIEDNRDANYNVGPSGGYSIYGDNCYVYDDYLGYINLCE